MALETFPLSVPTIGNLRTTFVPSGSNPLSVAILSGATAKDLTYSFTPSGFNHAVSQASAPDPRLTAAQELSRPGKTTETLEVQYIWGDTNDVAKIVLASGVTGFIVQRRAVPNSTAWTTGQKVIVVSIQCGVQRHDAPVDNGQFTITQGLFITAPTAYDQTLVA